VKIILPDGSFKEFQIAEESIAIDLKCSAINSVEVLVAKNGRIILELDQIRNEDELNIIEIINGG